MWHLFFVSFYLFQIKVRIQFMIFVNALHSVCLMPTLNRRKETVPLRLLFLNFKLSPIELLNGDFFKVLKNSSRPTVLIKKPLFCFQYLITKCLMFWTYLCISCLLLLLLSDSWFYCEPICQVYFWKLPYKYTHCYSSTHVLLFISQQKTGHIVWTD